MCKHRNNVMCILRMALSAKMRWRLLHGGKNPQYGEFQWLGNAKCANKQINLSPNQKMYESAESGVGRVALGVWGGPVWQHAVSIMENHLQTNKYKEIPRSLNNSRWCSTHILFVVFIQKNYLQRDAGNTKNVVIFTVFFIRAPANCVCVCIWCWTIDVMLHLLSLALCLCAPDCSR